MSPHHPLLSAWMAAEQLPFTGWDFSYLKGNWIEDTPPWSYEALVRQLMPQATALLDLGTGGGEKLLEFRDVFPARLAATESYPPNLQLARQRLAAYAGEVRFSNADLAEILPFSDAEFDLVINRHSGYNIAEIERVLKPGGVFLTQQVDGKSTLDLLEAFDSQPHWPWYNLAFALQRLGETTHLAVEMSQEWSGRMIFKDVASLVYYLKAIPWIVDDFTVETHLPYLVRQQERLEREGQLVFHEKLLVIRARKPEF